MLPIVAYVSIKVSADPEPRMATIQGAAALLGVSTDTVRRRIADGTIPISRLGKRILVPRWWLEAVTEPKAHAAVS